jgi:formyltetrahydrofolate synthetase
LGNLTKQIENVRKHGVPVVVAINHFPTDTEAEVEEVRRAALAAGAVDVAVSRVFSEGGPGGVELARAVLRATEQLNDFSFLYALDEPIKTKIATIAREMYGAETVTYSPRAERAIRRYSRLGYDAFPICVAKTHLSLSGDPGLKGRPDGFELLVNEVRASVGAGYIYPIIGEMRTMPGLGSEPSGAHVDIDEEGRIIGLF